MPPNPGSQRHAPSGPQLPRPEHSRGMRERGRRRPATAPRSSTCPQYRGRGHCSQPMERTPARRTRLRPIPCHTRTGVARAVAATIRRTDSRPTINAAKSSVTHAHAISSRQQRAQPVAQAVAGAGRPFASCASPVRVAQTRCGGEVGRTWQRLRSHDLSAVTTHSTVVTVKESVASVSEIGN